MSEKTKRRRRRPANKPQYQYHPRAINISVYAADGSPVPQEVLDRINVLITAVAIENKLLTSVIEA